MELSCYSLRLECFLTSHVFLSFFLTIEYFMDYRWKEKPKIRKTFAFLLSTDKSDRISIRTSICEVQGNSPERLIWNATRMTLATWRQEIMTRFPFFWTCFKFPPKRNSACVEKRYGIAHKITCCGPSRAALQRLHNLIQRKLQEMILHNLVTDLINRCSQLLKLKWKEEGRNRLYNAV